MEEASGERWVCGCGGVEAEKVVSEYDGIATSLWDAADGGDRGDVLSGAPLREIAGLVPHSLLACAMCSPQFLPLLNMKLVNKLRRVSVKRSYTIVNVEEGDFENFRTRALRALPSAAVASAAFLCVRNSQHRYHHLCRRRYFRRGAVGDTSRARPRARRGRP